jgi:hypothetical protein
LTGSETKQPVSLSPFTDDSSVIWIPTKRTEWEDSVSEMTAVCTSAGLHQYHRAQLLGEPQKIFQPPLSRDYIRDRIDIDDPLRGYQIRHKEGGWLQGFLLWTNFTTWTHYFKWDSVHPQSGIQGTETSRPADRDGSLAQELEACERSGDPLVGGIVFPEIAEIALVGGLGCGEYLLRMALDDIRAEGKYKYVLLQATNESKTFYERFGFIRVGAICRYANNTALNNEEESLVGYRHWTHPNESDASLQLHGGPSYMMCLKLPPLCSEKASVPSNNNSFRAHMERLASTDRKPTIEQLGGTSFPSYWRTSSSVTNSNQANTTPKRKPGRRPSSSKPSPAGKKPITQISDSGGIALPLPPVAKRRFSNKTPNEPSTKRRRLNSDGASVGSATSVSSQSRKTKPVVGGKSNKSKTKKAPDMPERPSYHSIRGPDGRFIRVLVSGAPVSPPVNKSKPATTHSKPTGPPTTTTSKPKGPKRVNRAELKKQKVKAYPRDRIHYYNRVVKPNSGRKEYFFVLNYDESAGLIRMVPMRVTGVCLGKHAGRPRYQCVIGDTDANFRTDHADKYEVVPATMVMKTSVVANEAWDIQDK